MKKWPILLVLPLCVAAVALHSTRALTAPVVHVVHNQAELDALAARNPAADFDRAGHAYANREARLFWHTDLQSAEEEAARVGKPILMLRLLGNLSDEYSCANSRFFRVVFYPQSAINARLRRDFVLCWTSERPVPIVTIDMGDGRKLHRTLTGNSAHYLLDATGQPLDVFPGLSTPQAFESWLANGQKLAADYAATAASGRAPFISAWHQDQIRSEMERIYGAKSLTASATVKAALADTSLEGPSPAPAVPAKFAAPLAEVKYKVEAPALSGLDLLDSFAAPAPISGAPAILDDATRARIRALNPAGAPTAAVQTVASTPKGAEDALLATFETNLVRDTRRGQTMSIPIHALFARGHEGDFAALNRRIYDRLFLTPSTDAWLGLRDASAFSALQNDGVELPTTKGE